MQFVIAVEPGGEDAAFGVVVPDLPGCYSAGDTFEEALVNAREAIVLHLEALGAQGVEVVEPQGIDAHFRNPDFEGWMWGFVDVDDRLMSDKVERINITVPSRKLQLIDRAAVISGKARSEYLVENGVARAMVILHSSDHRVAEVIVSRDRDPTPSRDDKTRHQRRASTGQYPSQKTGSKHSGGRSRRKPGG